MTMSAKKIKCHLELQETLLYAICQFSCKTSPQFYHMDPMALSILLEGNYFPNIQFPWQNVTVVLNVVHLGYVRTRVTWLIRKFLATGEPTHHVLHVAPSHLSSTVIQTSMLELSRVSWFLEIKLGRIVQGGWHPAADADHVSLESFERRAAESIFVSDMCFLGVLGGRERNLSSQSKLYYIPLG